MRVKYSYLEEQFKNPDYILRDLEKLVKRGDFTLGKEVEIFEKRFAQLASAKFAVGVSSGTAALLLGLQAVGVGHDDEVITAPNTFFASVNAIAAVGAKPVFVDVGEDYNINSELIEDAAQAIGANYRGRHVGNFGDTGGFSFHPLKNLNVWGDAGMIITNNPDISVSLCELRNQGLKDRDTWTRYGHNLRISSLQALVGKHLIKDTSDLTERRIANALNYDKELRDIEEITFPQRMIELREVFHTYVIQAERRDELNKYLNEKGIESKIHYPVPLHLQPATKYLGYKKGDFPQTEMQAERIISLPVHPYLKEREKKKVIETIKEFYR